MVTVPRGLVQEDGLSVSGLLGEQDAHSYGIPVTVFAKSIEKNGYKPGLPHFEQ